VLSRWRSTVHSSRLGGDSFVHDNFPCHCIYRRLKSNCSFAFPVIFRKAHSTRRGCPNVSCYSSLLHSISSFDHHHSWDVCAQTIFYCLHCRMLPRSDCNSISTKSFDVCGVYQLPTWGFVFQCHFCGFGSCPVHAYGVLHFNIRSLSRPNHWVDIKWLCVWIKLSTVEILSSRNNLWKITSIAKFVSWFCQDDLE